MFSYTFSGIEMTHMLDNLFVKSGLMQKLDLA